MRRTTGLALLLLFAAPAAAEEPTAHEQQEEADAELGDGAAAEPPDAASIEPKRLPLGSLSDPDEEPEDIFDALVSGKVHFDDRLRAEYADTTGRKPSYAFTNRLRLGYETKAFHGFSGLAEFENVATPNASLYFVPPTDQGDPDRTPVADPRGTEINRIYARYRSDSIADSGVMLDVKGGRQRVVLDDERFVGAVAWRQFEQTFDAARISTDFGVDGLTVDYAYIWHVQRIFGPEGPNWDSDSHLARVSYEAAPEITITPFIYLLDFRDDSPLDSVDTYGVRLTGDLWRDADDDEDLFADYEFTYAHQTEGRSNPVDFDADFLAVQARVTKKRLGAAGLGYQLLGSDDGAFGFRFPLGTNHAFQGFADQFLVTPPEGIQDLYVSGRLDLPHNVGVTAIFHQFWTDEGGRDLGYEVDLVASVRLNGFWTALAKGAFFDGHSGQPDTTKVWLQTTIRF